MTESIFLSHPATGAVYESTSLDQARAMATTGWVLASRAEVDKAAKAAVDEQSAVYEARMANDERVEVTADSKPKGFSLDAPKATGPEASRSEAQPLMSRPTTSGAVGAVATDPEN